MHFLIIGINFKTADVNIREKLHFPNDVLSKALLMLNEYESIKGSVILSTCNRVEIYASVNNVEKGFEDIIDFISIFHNIPVESFLPYLYKKNCQDGVMHLFKVSSSLNSMVLGEYQIQGQVRDAYFVAKENNSTNNMLNKLFQLAIRIGKKVRSETKIGEGSVSVATLAVKMIKQTFEDNNNLNILLIGAGKISNLTASNLQQQFKNCNITVANRSNVNATELAQKFNGKVIEYGKRYESIIDNDIIIASTSAPNFIICKQDILMMKETLKDKPRIYIDLSIPRNIDPEINSIENCFVYSIDDINKIIDSNIDKRTLEITQAEKIINDISEDYYDWYSKQFILPFMQEIKKEMITLKQNTLSTYETFLYTLDEEQKENVNEMLDSYSDKIIKVIMTNFRRAATKEDLISITKTLSHTFTLETNERKKRKYIVATRPSLLAYTQTKQTVDLLKEKNPDCEFEIIKFSTHGDKVTDKPLTEFGGTGVFVKELENAIIQGKAHFAVHSLKDVPSVQPEELILASFPKREDPRDVILIKNEISINELNDSCIIGTGSPRRLVQIAEIKPKAVFKDLRGNIDTRLKKLEDGLYDAIVLAAAGLKRLGKQINENAFLSVDSCIPAIGQGAIAIECKKDDKDTKELLRTINDNNTEISIIAERSYLKTIGGGCKFPLAAFAKIENNLVHLFVMIGNHHTNQIIRMSDKSSLAEAEELGKILAEKIILEAGKQGIKIEY